MNSHKTTQLASDLYTATSILETKLNDLNAIAITALTALAPNTISDIQKDITPLVSKLDDITSHLSSTYVRIVELRNEVINNRNAIAYLVNANKLEKKVKRKNNNQ
jgi:hypothetical protein